MDNKSQAPPSVSTTTYRGYTIVQHECRMQPFTVWIGDNVHFFAKTIEEAINRIDAGGRRRNY